MTPDLHTADDGEQYGLGCNPPDSFPTGFRTFADAVPTLTLDQIRAKLAGVPAGTGAFNRRTVFDASWIGFQRSHGSCNGYACARALSRTRYLRGLGKVLLSGADAYSQMNGGRDNGSTLADGIKVVEANGIAPEEMVPWNQIYTRQISAAAKAERARYKGFELYAVDTQEELFTAMLLGFVTVVAVHVGRGFDQYDGDGICKGGNGVGNHSVGCDDLGMLSDGELWADMFNSWSPQWGQEGRTKLTWRRHLAQTVRNHRFFACRASLDDPQAVNPPVAA